MISSGLWKARRVRFRPSPPALLLGFRRKNGGGTPKNSELPADLSANRALARNLQIPGVGGAVTIAGKGAADQIFVSGRQTAAVRCRLQGAQHEKFIGSGQPGDGQVGLARERAPQPLPGAGEEIGGGEEVEDAMGHIPWGVDDQPDRAVGSDGVGGTEDLFCRCR